jgi:phosphoribosylanthranilate isomerase
MIVQIYSLTHADDVRALVELGVDHIGLAPAGQGVPAEVEPDDARALLALLPSTVRGLALTVSTDVETIAKMAERVRPAIVHICSLTDAISVAAQHRLRALLPNGTRIMKAIAVGGSDTAEQALAAAERFAPISDFLLLDTVSSVVPGIGAAGRVHDWGVSARIVERVGRQVPVILAGGLGPDNVAAAIRQVRPAGVDSFTWTNESGQGRRKDLDLVRRFVQEARRAAAEIGG